MTDALHDVRRAEGREPVRLPAYHQDGVTVYLGDAREVMADLPAESVDCTITSPPYWGLRDFGVPATVWGGDPTCRHRWSGLRRPDVASGHRFCLDCDAWLGSLGLEPTPQLFVAHLVEVFRGVRRLLKPTGTVWLNLGDTFYQRSRGRGDEHGLKPKDLVGIPWRTALALQADGWYLRSDIVWHKPSSVPEPARDRPARAHEFLFLLSKQPRYYWDAEAIREPAVSKPSGAPWPMPAIHAGKYASVRDPRVLAATKYARRKAPISTTRHKRSVWSIPSEPFLGSHTATFPTKLVEPCILAGSSAAGCCAKCGRPWSRLVEISYRPLSRRREGRKDPRVFDMEMRQVREARTVGWRATCDCDATVSPAVVFDPFAGTGTTLSVAKRLGRTGVGVELNADYQALIEQRCSSTPVQPSGTAAA